MDIDMLSDTAATQALKVVEDREQKYGSPSKNFEDIASIWEGVTGHSYTASQVALMMIGVKLSREGFRHRRDNIVDIIGYAECLDRINVQQ